MDRDRAPSKTYARLKYTLFFIDICLTLIFLVGIQASGISSYYKDMAYTAGGGYYTALFVYFALFSLSIYLVGLPLSFYSGYLLEHRFALSNQSPKDWAWRELKRALLSFLVSAALVELFYLVLRLFPSAWWLVASLGWISFSIFLARIFPVLVIPLFYRYRDLDDEGLRRKLLDLAGRAGVKVTGVFAIDLSKDTKKSNAALVGWGDTRRIVLADNLIREFSPDEITCVVAHETAHYKFRHIWKLILLESVSITALFYALKLISKGLVSFLKAGALHDIAIYPSLALFFFVFNLITLPAKNMYSRTLERQADMFAVRLTGLKEAFIGLMEKLGEKNLSDKSPNKLIEFLLYSHPSVSRRIESAKRC